jgi:dinuclear metal center YbgI/SA1388 family protein
MTVIRTISEYLKSMAPLNLAEDWDNVGVLVGDESAEVHRILTCLTLTADVAEEAVATGAQLVVTHHPVLFKPVKQIAASTAEGRMLLKLIQNSIAVYSPHTAWDNCPSGINQQLAEQLNLRDIAPLRSRAVADQAKIVTFVPESDLKKVRQALWDAGAGVIGNYRNCSFHLHGTGTFFGTEAANPAVGQSGQLESVDEVRLEVVCPLKLLDAVLAALRTAHPYEEPAVDVFSVKKVADILGAGRCGRLPSPMRLDDLCRAIGTNLRQPYVQFVGDSSLMIERVGVACGAAGEFLRDAHRAGCQAFLTGEARFHSCLEAKELGVSLILPGHYATERFSMETLAKRLSEQFPSISVTASEKERDPVDLCVVGDRIQ